MHKQLLMIAVGLGVAITALADDAQSSNPYLQQMQQKFNQASANANAQFNKSFPKPVRQQLPPPAVAKQSTAALPAQQNILGSASSTAGNSNAGTGSTSSYANNTNYSAAATTTSTAQTPDVTVNQQNNGPTPLNIYAPSMPGASTNSANNSTTQNNNNNTPNIYANH